MKKVSMVFFAMMSLLVACSEGGGKKVLIISSGNFETGENTVKMTGGSSHNEKELFLTANKLTVTSEKGNQEFDVPENGYYLLNLKNDTLVGSYQRVGTQTDQQVITQEDLKKRVDSINQLMAGTNVSAANRNFAIAPKQIQKITGNMNAQIIGPFKRVPGSFEAGKEHEIYKFFTNKEMIEIRDKLKGMMSDTIPED